MIKSDFQETEKYLSSLIPIKSVGMRLTRIKHLLNLLGNPEKKFPVVHVGGTAGKGSTAFLIASLFSAAGYKVGLHLSPHLQYVGERLQINNQPISPRRLVDLVEKIKPLAERMGQDRKLGKPSYFEFTVAATFLYFAQEKVDLAVVEVGLGGTLDGTNVVDPLISVITNIQKDHTEILGNKILEIAKDKAGIIKEGRIVVSGVTQKEVCSLFEKISRQKHARLLLSTKDFNFKIKKINENGEIFDLQTPRNLYKNLSLSLLGGHQVKNATLAIVAAEELQKFDFRLPEKILRKTLSQAQFPGRLEKVQASPLVFLDGAHNPSKMQSLTKALKIIFPRKKIISVVAIKKGKNLQNTLKHLNKISQQFILTTFQVETDTLQAGLAATDPQELTKNITSKEIMIEAKAKNAVRKALKIAHSQDLVLVTGSLYLVGEVRDLWYPRGEILRKQSMFSGSGKRKNFATQVYQAIKRIPKGKVATYGQIAKIVGNPGAARAVGRTLNKNPFAPIVPCHRVVGSDGHLTGFAKGLKAKEKLLKSEGVKIIKNRINLKEHLWGHLND
ncbi:methylated-DNA--[protein]-cysteine S-methyltransferase [Candidatus Microgenomates bacterium]|nr:methylated-DNA--[protein]-cysteine S-methyltransferase [Candidatus Microgenomates bacterium]